MSDEDIWTSSSSDQDDGRKDTETKDVATGEVDNERKCDFCQKYLLVTEIETKLDCGHVLCPNCFNLFKSKKNESCPICFKEVSNFIMNKS
ncbi:hypothetical protein M9Y10_037981 [Tritrichomonas musculus]|uniref:RING-type domain-containing protein n=1 Tax=Tritrichomonas musculus TaxID=1915356 RepID=A0ABR2K763_9EUKA